MLSWRVTFSFAQSWVSAEQGGAQPIIIYTEGVQIHPGDTRLLRHRGHGYVTTR